MTTFKRGLLSLSISYSVTFRVQVFANQPIAHFPPSQGTLLSLKETSCRKLIEKSTEKGFRGGRLTEKIKLT